MTRHLSLWSTGLFTLIAFVPLPSCGPRRDAAGIVQSAHDRTAWMDLSTCLPVARELQQLSVERRVACESGPRQSLPVDGDLLDQLSSYDPPCPASGYYHLPSVYCLVCDGVPVFIECDYQGGSEGVLVCYAVGDDGRECSH